MSTPSLLLVPARFKAGSTFSSSLGILYSQIPTNGDGDFRLQRDGLFQTRYNDQGLVERVGTSNLSNVIPRLDYYTSSGTPGCPALLVEPSAQNLALQSADFNTTWQSINSATVNTNTAISPDGTQNADTINLAAVNNSRVRQPITLANSTTYTISCFYKNIALTAGETFGMRFDNGASSPNNFVAAALIDLASGTATYSLTGTSGTGFSGTATGRVDNYGNGWYRVLLTFTVGSAGGGLGSFEVGHISLGAVRSFYAWGAQLELGSIATSYIPTTTVTGSRSADVISVSGAVSGSIGQTQGTIYCEFAYFGQPVIRSGPIYLRQAASRGLSINYSPSDFPLGISFISRNDAGPSPLTIVSGALQIGTYYKIAIGYDAGGTAAGGSQASGVVAYVNGVQTAIGTFRVPDAAGLTEFRMYGANSGTDAEAFNGRIRAAALYTTRLTNADLMLLTMPGNDTYLPQAVWNNYLSRTGNAEVPDCLYTRHADLLDV